MCKVIRGVCYLYGNQTIPLIHGTVTFREERKNYICVDIDLQGIPSDYLYGIKVGQMLFPPIAPDSQGELSVTFCRQGDFESLFGDSTVVFFRYNQRVSNVKERRQNVASGQIRRLVCGGPDYGNVK